MNLDKYNLEKYREFVEKLPEERRKQLEELPEEQRKTTVEGYLKFMEVCDEICARLIYEGDARGI